MLYAMLLLAQVVSAQPSLPPEMPSEAALTETIVTLDEEREAVLKRDADGKLVEAIVRRFDGRAMTCDPYFAWVSQEYTCTGNCGNSYQANGHYGGTSRSNACANARADMCSQASCSGGTYSFCSLIEAESAQLYSSSPTCAYATFRACLIDENCNN
jgi:hypothetical protein